MATRVVCPDCDEPLMHGRLSCAGCGVLLASVAGAPRREPLRTVSLEEPSWLSDDGDLTWIVEGSASTAADAELEALGAPEPEPFGAPGQEAVAAPASDARAERESHVQLEAAGADEPASGEQIDPRLEALATAQLALPEAEVSTTPSEPEPGPAALAGPEPPATAGAPGPAPSEAPEQPGPTAGTEPPPTTGAEPDGHVDGPAGIDVEAPPDAPPDAAADADAGAVRGTVTEPVDGAEPEAPTAAEPDAAPPGGEADPRLGALAGIDLAAPDSAPSGPPADASLEPERPVEAERRPEHGHEVEPDHESHLESGADVQRDAEARVDADTAPATGPADLDDAAQPPRPAFDPARPFGGRWEPTPTPGEAESQPPVLQPSFTTRTRLDLAARPSPVNALSVDGDRDDGPAPPAGAWLPPAAFETAHAARVARTGAVAAPTGDAVPARNDLVGWLVAAGSALATLGFLLPWARAIPFAAGLGYTDRWGLAIPSHAVVLVAAAVLLGFAIVPNRMAPWIRNGALPLALGALVTGLVWPYVIGGYGFDVGSLVTAVAGAVLVLGGLLGLRGSRHAAGWPAV